MRYLASLLLALLPLAAFGQIRTGSDAAAGNFVIGIDNYLRITSATGGKAGFDFSTGGQAFKAIAEEGNVTVGDTALLDHFALALPGRGLRIPAFGEAPEMIIGIHDFTADREPELVVALRDLPAEGLVVYIFSYEKGAWKVLGEIAAYGAGVRECRIFRQVVTIERGEGLHTWTYRGGKFDYRSNSGSKDPASLLPSR